jgi:hypothetical protein
VEGSRLAPHRVTPLPLFEFRVESLELRATVEGEGPAEGDERERRRRASVSSNPRDGLGSHASGEIATRDLNSTKCSGWPPLAGARIRTGIAPQEGLRPGLCARPAVAGDKGGRIRCAGPDTRLWGAGGVQGGPFSRGPQ